MPLCLNLIDRPRYSSYFCAYLPSMEMTLPAVDPLVQQLLDCVQGSRGQPAEPALVFPDSYATTKASIPTAIFVLHCRSTTNRMAEATKAGRKAGTGNYTRDECLHLFTIMQRILPIGPEEWQEVAIEHAQTYPGRDEPSIRRKYHSLHRKNIPTGDPTMPPEVREAKRTKYMIADKANIGDGEEEFNVEESSFTPNTPNVVGDGFLLTQPSQASQGVSTQDIDFESTDDTEAAAVSEEARNHNNRTASTSGAGTVSASASATSASTSASSGLRGRALAHNQFMDLMRMKILQEQSNREADRQLLMAAVGAIANALAGGSNSTNSTKRRRLNRERSSSMDSDC